MFEGLDTSLPDLGAQRRLKLFEVRAQGGVSFVGFLGVEGANV